jgi:outer membrane protein
MKKLLTSCVFTAVTSLSVSAQADVLGFSIDAKAYRSTLTDNDSNDKSDSSFNTEYSFAFEHPVPFIPNVRLAYADFSFDFDDADSTDQGFIDGTLYYELLDNIVELDLGLTARVMDISDASNSYKNDSTSALLFAKVQGNLPFVGLSAGAIAQAGGNGDDSILDAEVFVQYEFLFGLGVKGGYRMIQQDVELDSKLIKNLEQDSDFEGAYLGAFFHF